MTIETNADKVYQQFLELTTKEQRKALKSAVRTAAGRLRTEARRNLRSRMPSAARASRKYGDILTQGIRYSKVKEDRKGEIYTFVLISTTPANKVSYRLKWFEKGATNRRTRKGYNRGSIKALNFYSDAVRSVESEYRQIIDKAIQKTINKINKTKFKA